jgi:hypothetical protein
VPAAQLAQSELPSDSWYLPDGQLWQSDAKADPDDAWKVPAPQATHSGDPACSW